MPVLGADPNHIRHLRLTEFAQQPKPKQVNNAAIVHDAAPKSPPHTPDITPGDLHENVDYGALKASEQYVKEFGGIPEGSPGDFYGGTCKEVCTSCFIAATDEFPSCNCKASCVQGSDSTICPKKLSGWLGKRVTTPDSKWKAVCNAGQRSCDECVDDKVKEEIEKCRKDRIPALCYHNLKMKYGSAEAPFRYCLKTGFKSCERFTVEAPKEEGWTCFDEEAKCLATIVKDPFAEEEAKVRNDALVLDNSHPPLETPCIWCSIPPPKR